MKKHKVKMKVPVEKRGLFGKKTVLETRVVEVDDKTYRDMKKAYDNRPYTVEEMFLYDELLGD